MSSLATTSASALSSPCRSSFSANWARSFTGSPAAGCGARRMLLLLLLLLSSRVCTQFGSQELASQYLGQGLRGFGPDSETRAFETQNLHLKLIICKKISIL
eukprot:16451738-Heterocapsa_arctica.AAC.1